MNKFSTSRPNDETWKGGEGLEDGVRKTKKYVQTHDRLHRGLDFYTKAFSVAPSLTITCSEFCWLLGPLACPAVAED